MKKFILPVLAISFLVACGGGESAKPKTETKTELSDNPDYKKGLALIGESDCLTCHKIDEKLQGPSYRDVANKYAGTSDTIVTHLAHKIIKGGTGVWGDISMTPHSGLSQEDAEAMVKYILLLKNK